MKEQKVVEKVKKLIEPVLEENNVELVDISYRWERDRKVLRFLVDKPGRITLDECSHLNGEIGQILDETDTMEERYTLEVSSPGLDRLLVSMRDFQRVIGEPVKIVTSAPIEKKNVFIGRLKGVSEDKVLLESDEGLPQELPLQKIAKARLEIGFR